MNFLKRIKNGFTQFASDLTRFIQYGDLPTWYYIKKGLKVGKCFNRQSGTRLDITNCWLIEIGDRVVLANRVQLLAHDDSAEQLCGYRRAGKIVIEDDVFVGAGTLILPGVTIGKGSIIGAGSVVSKSIPANSIAVGVPARVIKTVNEYVKKTNEDIERAKNENRILDLNMDIHGKLAKNDYIGRLLSETTYYFNISRFCDEKEG